MVALSVRRRGTHVNGEMAAGSWDTGDDRYRMTEGRWQMGADAPDLSVASAQRPYHDSSVASPHREILILIVVPQRCRAYGAKECLTLVRTGLRMSKDVQSAFRRLDIANRCN